MVGRAPLLRRYSAISRPPVWAAASSGVSKSPPPQSQQALTSSGVASTSSRTFSRLRWAWPTMAWTLSGANPGGFGGGLPTPGGAGLVSWAAARLARRPEATRPAVVRRNERREFIFLG